MRTIIVKSYKPSDILADKLGLSPEDREQFLLDTPEDWLKTLCPEYFIYGANGDIVGEMLNYCATRSGRNNIDSIRAWSFGLGSNGNQKRKDFINVLMWGHY